MSGQLNIKYKEACDDTMKRFKRGLINGIGSIFK